MVSWKLFNIGGIDIKIHWTTLLFLGFFFIWNVNFFLILLVLFISITLHELSHSVVARNSGININQIILLPIGGMAIMKDTAIDPRIEFKMAIAGPMFNFFVCSIILVSLYLTGNGNLLYSMDLWNEQLAENLTHDLIPMIISSFFWLNLLLGAFNLFFPAIPLDGGRVLRSLLAMVIDYVKATRIATIISTFLTIFLFFLALMSMNLVLLVISIFIFFGARSEMEFAISHKLLKDFPLSSLVRQNFLLVDENTSLDTLITDMIASRSLIAFSKDDRKITSVTIYNVSEVPRQRWEKTKFKDIGVKIRPVHPHTPVIKVLMRMNQEGLHALPVVGKNYEILGCVYKEDIETVLELLKLVRLS